MIDCLSFFLVPSWSSNKPFYPQSVANQRTRTTPFPSTVFTFGLAFESITKLGDASKLNMLVKIVIFYFIFFVVFNDLADVIIVMLMLKVKFFEFYMI